jgi:metal-sulfur cluster biosynthetic enzyme
MGRSIVVIETETVRAAVGRVLDPHINVNLNEMGMVRDIVQTGEDSVEVSIVFPCLGCPAYTMLKEQIKQQVGRLEGISKVEVKVDWEAQWDRSQMSDRAKEYAQTYGYRI